MGKVVMSAEACENIQRRGVPEPRAVSERIVIRKRKVVRRNNKR